MPILKPKEGEPKNAFISRCMGDDAMSSEYPKQDQRAGVCHTSWGETQLIADELYSIDAEILAPGKWNDINITLEHMEQAVNNFRALGDLIDVPLKFGHNKKQKMTDGQPALGWVTDIWIKSGRIMARFTDMPKIVYEAIKAKRYKNVSIEGMFDVEHKGKKYGFVLKAVALLGVDMPAVNTLNDLQTYLIAKNDLQFTNLVTFTSISGVHKHSTGEGTMTPEEEAALRQQLADTRAENITLSAEKTVAETKAKKSEEDKLSSEKTALFTAQKVELTASGEKLVKEGKATPAQRDAVLKDLTAEGVEGAKATFSTLALAKAVHGLGTGEAGQSGNKKDEDKAPDDILHFKTLEFAAKNGCDYDVANDAVMAANPDLAREYVNLTGTN